MNQLSPVTIILGLLCAGGGAATLLFSKGLLFRLFSWRYREEESSRAAPVLDRLAGCLLILLGIVLLFV